MAELLGCPFCGGEPELTEPDQRIYFWVECTQCHAKSTIYCGGHGATPDEAIAAWNRRAPAGLEPAIRKLEWIDNGNGGRVETIVGLYRIRHDGDEPDEWSWDRGGRLGGFYRSEDTARAAAQADFDARIRAALVPAVAEPLNEPYAWLVENPENGNCILWSRSHTDIDRANVTYPYATVTPVYAAPIPAAAIDDETIASAFRAAKAVHIPNGIEVVLMDTERMRAALTTTLYAHPPERERRLREAASSGADNARKLLSEQDRVTTPPVAPGPKSAIVNYDHLTELVVAARMVAFEDRSADALRRLDKASEAFASIIRWDDEPLSEAP